MMFHPQTLTPTKAGCTPEEGQKTTVFHSDKLNQMDFASQWETFMEHVQGKIPRFTVDATNLPILEAVLAYFIGDKAMCQKLSINLKKGLLLLGPVGCGKTTIMKLFSHRRFQVVATRDIVRKFFNDGSLVLEKYGAQSFQKKHLGYGPVVQYDQPITYCFDDLGIEPDTKIYGNSCNVMAEILLDRYDQFIRHGMLTHLTTNLNADALEQRYGDRVRSRLREMFNLVSFPAEAPDRRK